MNQRGFTLIEVLVVVAIIALLVSILLPSLAAAREISRITVCMANSKQIATMISQYRSEYDGYVPVVYNYWANVYNGSGTPKWHHPARTCWLSVALRHYYPGLRNLGGMAGGRFDPGDKWTPDDPMRGVWSDSLRTEYENTILPDFFMCPFARGKGPHRRLPTVTSGNEVHGGYEGKFESYHTWLWDAINRGTRLNSSSAPKPWTAKYPVLCWNKGVEQNNNHTKWDITRDDASEAGAMSPAEFTVVYCGQGEFTPFPEFDGAPTRRYNVNSHRKSEGGGTNAIFADTHVEWVLGQRIGRP